MKNVGTTKPNAPPRAWELIPMVKANTRSFAPNQTAAILAGAFNKKGYPIAANVYPLTQAATNPHGLINTFSIIPKLISKVPIRTPVLHP